MRLLAIESSQRLWQVALLAGEQVVAAPPASDRSAARFLQVDVDTALRTAEWQPSELQGIAVNVGPGAFTSLRVGLTMAKSIAYALQIPLFGASALELLAAIASSSLTVGRDLISLVDAQRGEFVWQAFRCLASNRVEPISLPRLDPLQRLRVAAPSDAVWAIAAASSLARHGSTPGELQSRVLETPLDAVSIGTFVARQIDTIPRLDPLRALPEYYRPSYADEKQPPAT